MEITGNTFFYGWEVSLMTWLQAQMGEFGILLAEFFTYFGEPFAILFVIGMFYWGFDKKYGEHISLNLFAICLWGPMIKNLALRRRPYLDHEEIKCLRPVEDGDINDISLQGFSFPSLHSANATALYSLTAQYVKNNIAKIVLWLLPFFVGLSRIVLGVHYPTDVLAGWIFGLLVMLVISLLERKLSNNLWICLILVISGIPGLFFCKSSDFYTAYGLVIGGSLAFLFERHFVNFGPAKNFWFILLRVWGGGVIYIALNTLLKLPFSDDLLESATTAAYLIRLARYTIVTFFLLGVYPLCFRKNAKRWDIKA